MDVQEYMKKHNLTDQDLHEMAHPYETGEFELSEGRVYTGSHLDAVGKKRVTVIYDSVATQKVDVIARNKGVRASDIYREALDKYLVTC